MHAGTQAVAANPPLNAWSRLVAWFKARPIAWLALALLLLLALYFYPEGPVGGPATLAAKSPATDKRPVEIEASLDRGILPTKGEVVDLMVAVNNRSSQAISQPHLTLLASGFEFTVPACSSGGKALDATGLAAGSSCTFSVPLRAGAYSGSYPITAIVAWRGQAPDSAYLALGPVRFEGTFGAARWARLGRRVTQLVKDLTLPLVLFFLTNYFTSRQKEREEAARDADKRLERVRLKAQERRAQRQQVRQLLLTQVMDLAQKYYMPIGASAVLVLRELRKVEENDVDASVDRVLFHALNLIRAMDTFRRERGGIFFKKLGAEYLVSHAWIVAKETMFPVLTEAQIDLALAHPEMLHSYSTFTRYASKFRLAKSRMETWIMHGEPDDPSRPGAGRKRGAFVEYAGLLDIMQAVLRHELNRMLWEDWYDDEDMPEVPWNFTRNLPADSPKTTLPSAGSLTRSQQDSLDYIRDNLTRYCNRQIA